MLRKLEVVLPVELELIYEHGFCKQVQNLLAEFACLKSWRQRVGRGYYGERFNHRFNRYDISGLVGAEVVSGNAGLLRENNMKVYDEYALLMKNRGWSCQDELYLEEME